jgi:hypothetical protein
MMICGRRARIRNGMPREIRGYSVPEKANEPEHRVVLFSDRSRNHNKWDNATAGGELAIANQQRG